MTDTPRTDAAALGFARILIDHKKHTTTEIIDANVSRQLERELNAALICAGVASKERGEWAAECAANIALIRAAIMHVLDNGKALPRGIYRHWDFHALDDYRANDDRVTFADQVIEWMACHE